MACEFLAPYLPLISTVMLNCGNEYVNFLQLIVNVEIKGFYQHFLMTGYKYVEKAHVCYSDYPR